MLFQNEFCKIKRESISVIQYKRFRSAHFFSAICLGLVDNLVEKFDSCLQCAEECVFFLFNYRLYQIWLLLELWVGIAHRLYQCVHKTVYECLTLVKECVCIPNSTAQDASNHITCLGVRWKLSFGNREGDCTYMVGDYAHCYVNLLVFAITFS